MFVLDHKKLKAEFMNMETGAKSLIFLHFAFWEKNNYLVLFPSKKI